MGGGSCVMAFDDGVHIFVSTEVRTQNTPLSVRHSVCQREKMVRHSCGLASYDACGAGCAGLRRTNI